MLVPLFNLCSGILFEIYVCRVFSKPSLVNNTTYVVSSRTDFYSTFFGVFQLDRRTNFPCILSSINLFPILLNNEILYSKHEIQSNASQDFSSF